ncbi:MAG: EAL domain-containing protein [Pseudomonadota bacterium]
MAVAASAREVRVGVYENTPKIFTDAQRQPAGIFIDLLRETAAHEGWRLSFVRCEWQACLRELEAGRLDLLPDVAYSEERARLFDFHAVPVLHSWSQVYRRPGVAIESPLDLNGKRVALLSQGIQRDWFASLALNFGIQPRTLPVATLEEGFRLVRDGKADAAIANHYFGERNALRFGLQETPVLLQPVRLFYATPKGRNPELLAAIDRDLANWKGDGRSVYYRTIKAWAGHVEAPTIPRHVWLVLAAGAGLILLLLLNALVLRRTVKHRTRQLAQRNAELQRLTQLYAALSQTNQAIVRCTDAAELFAEICRHAVNHGGMKMAWIGTPDPSSGLIRPVAAFGEGKEYLDGIEISLDTGHPTGQGPTGTAARERRAVWCQDFVHDSRTAPWHGQAARFHWGASASLPILCKGRLVGTLTLYAGEANAFDAPQQALLSEMASDIGFALERFEERAELLRADENLRVSNERLSFALQGASDGLWDWNLETDAVYYSPRWKAMLGYADDELENVLDTWKRLVDPEAIEGTLQRVEDYFAGRVDKFEAEFRMRHKDGHWVDILTRAQMATDADGRPLVPRRLVGTHMDITERKRASERIEHLAHFDQLTGLPNRHLLREHFKFALSLAQRSGEHLAVMFLDLDHFKHINDTLGHSVGDALLMEVARRLKSAIRAEDTVSHPGGDEFTFILPGTDENGAALVANKLLEVVAAPIRVEGQELIVTPSIGIALYPEDGADLETLSKSADAAMFRAKQAGRNGFRFFTQEMQGHSARNLQLSIALRQALAREQLQLHYQPQLAIADGRLIGAEALLRWTHPELGPVSPAEFIPIAEASGQIVPIGEWVLRTAATQMKAWMDQGLPPMVMAVNLSAAQFHHPKLLQRVSEILAEAGLAPEYLELELTEAVAMDDPQAAVAIMDRLHGLGIRMSIDDFGTGYSSLGYLKRFKVHKLKIDQSFVRDLSDDPEDRAIVTTIIDLAASLGLGTIAEGVETAAQLAFLRERGCDEVQGYFFSKPLPAPAFEAYARQPR